VRRPAAIVAIVFGMLLTTSVVSAAPVPSRTPKCVGTYLLVGEGGDMDIWTLSGDGTAQVTSSAEDVAAFSHEQGSWRQLPTGVVNATVLDFPIDGEGTPSQVARVDATLTFSNACRDVALDLDLRYYQVPAEDPLDPTAGTYLLSESYTGRAVAAH
jgi:hypothetical protein